MAKWQSIWSREAIREARKRATLTQREAAPMLGVRSEHLSYIENGRERASEDLIRRMAEIYDVSVASLLQPCYRQSWNRKRGEIYCQTAIGVSSPDPYDS